MPSIRSRSFVVAAIAYAITSLISTQIPLLNYLGYEFSALIGILGSIVSGLLTISLVRPAYRANNSPKESIFSDITGKFKQALVLNVLLLAIPLVVMITNAFFVKNCSLLQGLTFFVLIPLVSVVFGSSFGFFCSVHYRLPRIGLLVYYAFFLAYSAAEGYFTPAIFSYNFLYGYFPGLTYDEALGISWALVAFRVITLLVAATVVWFTVLLLANTFPGDSTWSKGISLAKALIGPTHRFKSTMILLGAVIVWFLRGNIGFESSGGFIESRLGSKYETAHFVIYYSSQSYDDEEIKWIAAEHEFRLKQIADAFFLPVRGNFESFIYPSSEEKERLIGTGTTNIAKPWSGQIHITKQSLDGTLKHELIHVFAAPFGVPGGKGEPEYRADRRARNGD